MKNEKNKKKRLLPILAVAVLGVATLSGCSTQESDAKWWNPLTWNWDALAFWKDKTPDVSEDVDPENGEEIEGNQQPDQRYAMGVHRLEAFGPTNKKTLTLNITPSNATIGTIIWSSDKAEVVVTKLTETTAEVYATKALPANKPATITATESLSGVSGTGLVYSIGMTEVVDSNIPPFKYAVYLGESPSTDNGKKLSDVTSGHHLGDIRVNKTTEYQQATLNVAYKGSKAPTIRYKGLHQGGTIQNASATNVYPIVADSVTVATYNIYIFEGDPSYGMRPVQYSIVSATYSDGPTDTWKNGVVLYTINLSTQNAVTGIDIGDVNIFE